MKELACVKKHVFKCAGQICHSGLRMTASVGCAASICRLINMQHAASLLGIVGRVAAKRSAAHCDLQSIKLTAAAVLAPSSSALGGQVQRSCSNLSVTLAFSRDRWGKRFVQVSQFSHWLISKSHNSLWMQQKSLAIGYENVLLRFYFEYWIQITDSFIIIGWLTLQSWPFLRMQISKGKTLILWLQVDF